MAKCEVCGKGVTFGIRVSHSHRRSNRTWKPNVKRVKVVLNGKEDDDKNGVLNAAGTIKTWEFSGVDLSSEKTVTVFAEDGSTMAQTGIVATMAEAVSSATITAFSLGDGAGNTYLA